MFDDRNGFLANVDLAALEQHESCASYCSLIPDMNALGMSVLKSMSVDVDDARHILLAVLYCRCLSTFQGCIMVAAKGMEAEASILLRALLEAKFNMAAVYHDAGGDMAKRIIAQDVFVRETLLNGLEAAGYPAGKQAEVTEALATVKQDKAALGVKKLTVKETAKAGQLLDEYETVYRYLSCACHGGIRDMEGSYVQHAGAQCDGLRYGPRYELARHLATALDTLGFALGIVCKELHLDINGRLEDRLKRLNALKRTVLRERKG